MQSMMRTSQKVRGGVLDLYAGKITDISQARNIKRRVDENVLTFINSSFYFTKYVSEKY